MSESREPDRHLPVRPNLEQLRHQAKDLLRSIRANEPAATAEFRRNYPKSTAPLDAKLADAQLALARAYGVSSWPRLVLACRLIDAIWRDDLEAVTELVTKHPQLLQENARGTQHCNWGPPMSYAANLGRDRIITFLHARGATDLAQALDRAVLQSRIDTARLLHARMGRPPAPRDSLGTPAYSLSVSGTRFLFEVGARVRDSSGNRLAAVDIVLETDGRNPSAKHEILEMYVQHGLELPDTPTMALHRGRIDLLEEHLRRDPHLLQRSFTHEEIYPPELGCHDQVKATQGTPLAGTTLLHICVDYDELEIAKWLLERGMDANVRATVDADGFGGHTPLFATVVSQPNFWMNLQNRPAAAPMTKLLFEHGADPNARASLRKQLHPGYGPKYDVTRPYEYRDVTPLGWGRRFHAQIFVSGPALQQIEKHGGHE